MIKRIIAAGIFCTLSVLVIFACGTPAARSNEKYFANEIGRRLEHIGSLQGRDSLKADARAINTRINELILLSKDIENLNACAHLANRFFKERSEKYGLNASDFREIDPHDHMNLIAETLLQNELDLLNQLIFLNDSSGLPLYTAQ